MRSDPREWLLYFIPEARGRMTLASLAALAMEGGASVVQLRLKGVGDREFMEAGLALARVCAGHGRPLVVNDRPDVAAALGAAGVHLGQTDMRVPEARRLLGPAAVIGVSVTTAAEAARAEEEGADYVGVGPVYPTAVKPLERPLGLETVASVRAATSLPLIAIGGIGPANAAEVVEAGADGVAVVSAISLAPDPARAAAELLETVQNALRHRRLE